MNTCFPLADGINSEKYIIFDILSKYFNVHIIYIFSRSVGEGLKKEGYLSLYRGGSARVNYHFLFFLSLMSKKSFHV